VHHLYTNMPSCLQTNVDTTINVCKIPSSQANLRATSQAERHLQRPQNCDFKPGEYVFNVCIYTCMTEGRESGVRRAGGLGVEGRGEERERESEKNENKREIECIHLPIPANMHTCMHIYTHKYTRIYVFMYIRMYIYIHMRWWEFENACRNSCMKSILFSSWKFQKHARALRQQRWEETVWSENS